MREYHEQTQNFISDMHVRVRVKTTVVRKDEKCIVRTKERSIQLDKRLRCIGLEEMAERHLDDTVGKHRTQKGYSYGR